MQIALTGLSGVALAGRGAWDLHRWWAGRRGQALQDGLLLLVAGLWFLAGFTAVTFFGLPFEPAALEELAFSELIVLVVVVVWKVRSFWRRRPPRA